ncbi:MAG: hypothetical protein NUV48_10705 [Peptococcaceae bacterium]|jgi:hypothetical protein|nr:hypothetical protein [Peptococcaceae bacterium]
MNYNIEDFTEEKYRELLRLAKLKYKFISYSDIEMNGKNILWRHDIDLSVHRSYKLALIEKNEGVVATYFIHLHNNFYNFFELEILNLVKEIVFMGHEVGLHFDPLFYNLQYGEDKKMFEKYLAFEKRIVEEMIGQEIKVFSFHNPETGKWINEERHVIENMVNTYSRYLKENYYYCSDSNGYWRHSRLRDILEQSKPDKIQVLTHPGWWTPQPMTPRERVTRCIEGRATKQHLKYDELLKEMGRNNVK